MSHAIFFLSQFLLFTLLFCFILNKLKVIKISLSPLLPMCFYLFAQSTGLYLTNINSYITNWIYEVQEIGMALTTGSIYLFLRTQRYFKKRYLNYILLVLSLSTVMMYLIGNFIFLPLWVLSFTWNKGIMYLVLYFATSTYLKETLSTNRRFFTFIILLTILFISEFPIPLLTTIIKTVKLDLFTPLLLCSLWLYIDLTESNRKDEQILTEEIINMFSLTTREVEVTTRLIEGASYQDIADELFLSKATIKTYINRVYKKADVNSKVELIHLLLSKK